MSFVRVLAVACLLIAGVSVSTPVFAQTAQQDLRTPIITEVPIPVPDPSQVPGSEDRFKTAYLTSGRVEDLAQYIGIVYNFLISIVGMVAAVAMIIGGFQYLTSAGDSGRIGAAKTRMANALIGVVLALGAYTILNTINPRLLQLKLPDLRAVTTELAFLPWCEDVMKGDPANNVPPAAVTPYGSGATCGYAGKYLVRNQEQTCIYAGTCRIERISVNAVGQRAMYRTCLQKPALTTPEVKKALADNPAAIFGECLGCADLTPTKAQSLGFSDLEPACTGWAQMFSRIPSDLKVLTKGSHTIKDGLFHFCYPHRNKFSCVGAFIDCYEVTRNQDDGTRGVGIAACSSDSNTCGCEGYDEEPTPIWTKKDGKYDSNYKGPEDHDEKMLGRLCSENPCKNYLDPVSGKQSFIKDCRGNRGAGRLVNVASGDIEGIGDCGNE